MFNICQCGSQDGYPHKEDCPYPYFRNDEQGIAKWEAAHASKVFQMVHGFDPETIRYARENGFWDLVDENGNPVELPAVFDEGNKPVEHSVAADEPTGYNIKPSMKKGYKFPLAKCPVCHVEMPENVIVRHMKSGCKYGLHGSPLN